MLHSVKPAARRSRGLTLIELLIATSIMAIMAGVLGGLALSVQMQSEHSQGHGEAVQHARVVLDRMQRIMNSARANDQFPGFLVVTDAVSGHRLPDTVVVWNGSVAAADAKGLPRWNEVIVFCPDPAEPTRLLEITAPGDTRVVPSLDATSAWRSELSSLKSSNSAEKVELTNLLRAAMTSTNVLSSRRGAVRFDVLQRPTDEQWTEYKNGARDWDDIDWVQGIYGSRTGLRQSWCRIELQLVPPSSAASADVSGQSTLTFFGSAAVYYKMNR